MKKFFLFFLLGLFFVGCGEEELAEREGYIAVLDAEAMVDRLAALRSGQHPQYILERVAREDPEYEMRWAVVEMLENQDVLFDLALEDERQEVRYAAFSRLTRVEDFEEIAIHSEDDDLRDGALYAIDARFGDAEALLRIAKETPFEDTKERAELSAWYLQHKGSF